MALQPFILNEITFIHFFALSELPVVNDDELFKNPILSRKSLDVPHLLTQPVNLARTPQVPSVLYRAK